MAYIGKNSKEEIIFRFESYVSSGKAAFFSSQTTGSMVCHLHPDHPTHFVTETAAACTGIFKPLARYRNS